MVKNPTIYNGQYPVHPPAIMSKPKPRGDIATRFQPQPDSLAAKPISVYLSKPDDAVVRSLPNRSDWLRTVIHNALVAEGLIHD